jgi:hypothetical protein
MKVFIATPAYDGQVSTSYMSSAFSLTSRGRGGMAVDRRQFGVARPQHARCKISRVRNGASIIRLAMTYDMPRPHV